MEKKKRLTETRLLSSRQLSAGRFQLRLVAALLLACFVLPCLVLVVLHPNIGDALSVLVTLQSTQTRIHIQAVEAEISGSSHRPVAQTRILVKKEDEEKQTSFLSAAESNQISPAVEVNNSIVSSGIADVIISLPPIEENKSMEDAMHTEEKVSVSDQKTKSEENVVISDAPIADSELNSSTNQKAMKSLIFYQTGTDEKKTIIMGESIADVELNSSTQQEETKLLVSDQETAGTEEKNTIIFGKTIADNTETNSSTPQERTGTQNAELVRVPLVFPNMQGEREENMSAAGATSEALVTGATEVPLLVKKQDSSNSPAGDLDAETNNVHCDFSQERSDTCSVRGDIRVDGRSSSITVATNSQSSTPAKIRPYSRKWEPQLMDRIREFSVETSSSNPDDDDDTSPRCTINHTAPAIVFSTGGFIGNFFHDFTDVLIPLFITSRQYQAEVHFLVSDFNSGWISKYSPILSRLSRHRIINLDDDDENVRCFPQVHVGLLSHKELGVDPSKTPNGYSIGDFRELLRSSYSLRRKSVGTIAGRKPRLLIMLRKGSRAFTNERQVVSMGTKSGFKVVTAGPEDARDLSHFARVVNSCDVMVGVHGAGLTNMAFLPDGASVVQILPWGGLHYACWHDFGEPAPDMGLNYFEYDIEEKESSLTKRYSRDDPVFRDPLSIHKKGFGAIWSVFLKDQTVKLDVTRFKTVLQEALRAVH